VSLQSVDGVELLAALGALVLLDFLVRAALFVLEHHIAALHFLPAEFAPAAPMVEVVVFVIALSAEGAHVLANAYSGVARHPRFDFGGVVRKGAMRVHEGAAREPLAAVARVFGQVRTHFGVARLRRAAKRALDHLRVGAARGAAGGAAQVVVEARAALEAHVATGANAERAVREEFGPGVHVVAANAALDQLDLHVHHQLQFGRESECARVAFERVGDASGFVGVGVGV